MILLKSWIHPDSEVLRDEAYFHEKSLKERYKFFMRVKNELFSMNTRLGDIAKIVTEIPKHAAWNNVEWCAYFNVW